MYLEGNLETKIFTDQVTGLVRRIREVAIRGNGTTLTLSFFKAVFCGFSNHMFFQTVSSTRENGTTLVMF